VELTKVQTALENERRDRQTKELEQMMGQKMENEERRDRQIKEQEQKMEHGAEGSRTHTRARE
jgi:hypothetical protein